MDLGIRVKFHNYVVEGRERGWELDSGAQGQGVGENRQGEKVGMIEEWKEDRGLNVQGTFFFYFGATVPHINKFKHVIL